jgi:ADP-ribose pyrophosphatase
MNPWQTLQSQQVYNNKWITVTQHDVINPAGNKGIYGVVHFKNVAVGVVPVDAHGNTWLVGQYRYTLEAYSWEIPEGGSPQGEDPLEAAKRELQEETGLSASHYEELLRMHLSNSVSDELAIVYMATGLSMGEADPEETEQLEVKKLPFEEAYQMVLRGQITDSMSVAALLRVKLMLLNGSLRFDNGI